MKGDVVINRLKTPNNVLIAYGEADSIAMNDETGAAECMYDKGDGFTLVATEHGAYLVEAINQASEDLIAWWNKHPKEDEIQLNIEHLEKARNK